MNMKKSKGIVGLIFVCIIASIFTVTMLLPVAAAAITVDGLLGAGEWNAAAWPTGDFVGDDPANDMPDGDSHGYDIRQVFAHYDDATNTMYIGLIVDDLPGDLDGDGNTDTLCSILYPDPGDCPGVGPYEHYTLTLTSINDSYPGANLAYADNAVALADGAAQYGADCVEFSLKNADTYIDPLDFCVSFSCGGDYDGPGEDLFQQCLKQGCGATAKVKKPGCFEENGTWITFDGSDSSGIIPPLKYKWTFTGGFFGDHDDEAITKVFVTAPVTATLTVTDGGGCSDSVSVSVPPCPGEVPIFTPLGMVGLVALLSALGLLTITMRKRR